LYAVLNILAAALHAVQQVLDLPGFPASFPAAVGQIPVDVGVLYLVNNRKFLLGAQSRIRRWADGAGASSAAASLACLIGSMDPKEAMDQAKARFRYVSLEKLAFEDLSDNTPDPALHLEQARLVKFGRCDAFISHSWHDDPDAKWAALQAWRASFVQERGREPRLWIDKVCIDQNNIDLDLRCLPIFLSGCDRLVVLCGNTYLSRLWCIMEIFSYIMMGGRLSHIDLIPIVPSDTDEDPVSRIQSSFEDFDAGACECFQESDKEKMLSVIQTAFGSVLAFNQQVSDILNQLQGRSRSWSQASNRERCHSTKSHASNASTAKS
jgi:hypothetical protein